MPRIPPSPGWLNCCRSVLLVEMFMKSLAIWKGDAQLFSSVFFPEIFPFSHWGYLKTQSTANLRKRPKVSDFLAQFFSDPKNDLPTTKMVDAFSLASHCPFYSLWTNHKHLFVSSYNGMNSASKDLALLKFNQFILWFADICSISFFPPLSPWSRCFFCWQRCSFATWIIRIAKDDGLRWTEGFASPHISTGKKSIIHWVPNGYPPRKLIPPINRPDVKSHALKLVSKKFSANKVPGAPGRSWWPFSTRELASSSSSSSTTKNWYSSFRRMIRMTLYLSLRSTCHPKMCCLEKRTCSFLPLKNNFCRVWIDWSGRIC